MDNVYTYLVPLPPGIDEMTAPCLDGYTVYIHAGLDDERMRKAYRHALNHIKQGDFEKQNAQDIEEEAHKRKEG